MSVLAIDPGGTSGIALRTGDRGSEYSTCVTKTPEELWDLFDNERNGSGGLTQVVIEKFATAGRLSHWGLYTIELVGGVKALCHHLHIPIAVQQPQWRYNSQQQAHEYLVSSGRKFVIHEEDALAHLMFWEKVENGRKVRGQVIQQRRPTDGTHR